MSEAGVHQNGAQRHMCPTGSIMTYSQATSCHLPLMSVTDLWPNPDRRNPSGESYMDVIQRLEPVIIEIERERECMCVVAHQAVLRALYGYFMKIPLKVDPVHCIRRQCSLFNIVMSGPVGMTGYVIVHIDSAQPQL